MRKMRNYAVRLLALAVLGSSAVPVAAQQLPQDRWPLPGIDANQMPGSFNWTTANNTPVGVVPGSVRFLGLKVGPTVTFEGITYPTTVIGPRTSYPAAATKSYALWSASVTGLTTTIVTSPVDGSQVARYYTLVAPTVITFYFDQFAPGAYPTAAQVTQWMRYEALMWKSSQLNRGLVVAKVITQDQWIQRTANWTQNRPRW